MHPSGFEVVRTEQRSILNREVEVLDFNFQIPDDEPDPHAGIEATARMAEFVVGNHMVTIICGQPSDLETCGHDAFSAFDLIVETIKLR